VHGEPAAMEDLARRIQADIGIEPHLPEYREQVPI
jgi:hypothetical protein